MIERGPDGWPRLLSEVRDLPVMTRRELSNQNMRIPAGTKGTVRPFGNRWNKLMFEAPKCGGCGIQPRVTGCCKKDFDPV